MRNFIENRPNRYEEVPDNLTSDRCIAKIDAILDDPAGYKVTDEYNHNDVRSLLRKHFGIKCIYCEASPIATSTFRIDHYRPKKKIKEDENHTGYYWLAYEWTNLLQTCQFCNGAKSNHFPLKADSFRVSENTPHAKEKAYRDPTTALLSREQRLLLHPELDEVESHFYFNSDGVILSDTDEGKESIQWYDLKRDDLIVSRKRLRDDYLKKIKRALKFYEQRVSENPNIAKEVLCISIEHRLEEIREAYEDREAFSLFHLYMFERFEDFFVSSISIQEYRDLLLDCYNTYRDKQQ